MMRRVYVPHACTDEFVRVLGDIEAVKIKFFSGFAEIWQVYFNTPEQESFLVLSLPPGCFFAASTSFVGIR